MVTINRLPRCPRTTDYGLLTTDYGLRTSDSFLLCYTAPETNPRGRLSDEKGTSWVSTPDLRRHRPDKRGCSTDPFLVRSAYALRSIQSTLHPEAKSRSKPLRN